MASGQVANLAKFAAATDGLTTADIAPNATATERGMISASLKSLARRGLARAQDTDRGTQWSATTDGRTTHRALTARAEETPA